MKFTRVLICFFSLFIIIGCRTQAEKKVEIFIEKPNVLIIFPDQLRRYSAGYWSEDKYKEHVIGKPDPVITPTIDKLAHNGIVFTNAISNYPLCSPFRGMLMSGMYPEQNGIWNNCRVGRDDSLKDDIPTLTDLFFEAGYNTSYFGKFHWLKTEPFFDVDGNYVGTKEAPGGHYVNKYDTYIPAGKARHNIEYFYQALKDDHFNPHIYSNDPNAIEGKKDGELHLPKVYSAKNESEKIIDYLQNKNSHRDLNKPFFMIWSLNPPHNPWGDADTDMEMMRAHYDTDKFPEIDRKLVVRENADLEVAKYARNYFAAVTSIDKYIGLVIDELEKTGVLDNTIVVFSSDHGEMLGSHGMEGKNVIEMEAMAIPFIVHWPKGLKAGGITDVLLSAPDILPTTMGLAGLTNKIPATVQGTNLSGLLTNPASNKVEKPDAVLLMLGNSRGILTHQYTLSLKENKKQSGERKEKGSVDAFIYDNINDPYQLKKIRLEDKPEVAKKLLIKLGEKLKMANDPWFKNKKFSELIPYASK
ncbi:sulfatase [Mariniflexile ostreae]|uniref:Sulfatase n=1 Tax=Mariniflexile ostreae TaxID=1520892 RepID=A0ABV5FF52_9FLAO